MSESSTLRPALLSLIVAAGLVLVVATLLPAAGPTSAAPDQPGDPDPQDDGSSDSDSDSDSSDSSSDSGSASESGSDSDSASESESESGGDVDGMARYQL